MRKLLLVFLLITSSFLSPIFAQSTLIGQGVFASNVFGPTYTTQSQGSVSKHAYIYDSSLLTQLRHGDSIFSISFFKDNFASISGNNLFRIYIRPTTQISFGTGSLDFAAEIGRTGFRKVYDNNPNTVIPAQRGFVTFEFDTPYYWDTTLGKNLELLVEYRQPDAQFAAFQWLYDFPGSQPTYIANQCKFTIGTSLAFASDTLTQSSDRKPMIRINHPRGDFEAGVSALYSLGRIPAPLGNPDTVKVLIYNEGKRDIVNRKAYLSSNGANVFMDSITYSLGKNQEGLFAFPIQNVTQIGMDTLTVVLSPDGVASNDTIWNLREATPFTYSYRNLRQGPSPGGIGFNGATGDFVAKFQSSQAKAINQIGVTFASSQNAFKLGIWDNSGPNGTPGLLLWESDTAYSSANFIMQVWPPVLVNGPFFVGVRQIQTNNIGFGYQNEDPVRNGTFFYTSPTGSTNWVDFAPGAPFRFLIEPRIQAENDVSPVSFNSPRDTLFIGNFNTIAPKATIRNIGVNDQTVAFETKCNIRFFGGQLMYTSSVWDTLSAGRSRVISFDSSFFPTNSGNYTVEIITLLSSDQFKQNDTLRYVIPVGKRSDVGITNVFEPVFNQSYQFNLDTVLPTIRIQNFGFGDANFPVFALIYDDKDSIVYAHTPTLFIRGLESATQAFNEYIPYKKGVYKFVAYTRFVNDTDPLNDTIVRFFRVDKDNDIAPNFALHPLKNQVFPQINTPIVPAANFINKGDKNQFVPFPVLAEIKFQSQLLYRDTSFIQVFAGDSTAAFFTQVFIPSQEGRYEISFISLLENDQDRRNDTLTQFFNVGYEKDIEVLSLIAPSLDSVLNLSFSYRLSVAIRNNGFANQFTPFPLVMQNMGVGNVPIQTIQRNATLASGDTEIFDFDSIFIAKPEGLITLRIFSALPGDENQSNDTLTVQFRVDKTYDFEIKASEVLTEVLLGKESFIPQIWVQNNSKFLSDSAFVSVLIYNPSGIPVYNRVLKTLPGIFSDADTLAFPPYLPLDTGLYIVHSSLFSSIDQNPNNDTFISSFHSVLKNDIALKNIVFSPVNDTFFLSDGFQSDVIVHLINNGSSLAKDALLLYSTVLENTTDTLKSEIEFSLDGYSDTFIHLDSYINPLRFDKIGRYFYTVSVFHSDDQILENNTLEGEFVVLGHSSVKTKHVKTDELVVFPNPTHSILKINLPNTEGFNGEIYDNKGQMVRLFQVQSGMNSIEIETEGMSSGVYYLKVQNGKHIFAARFSKL